MSEQRILGSGRYGHVELINSQPFETIDRCIKEHNSRPKAEKYILVDRSNERMEMDREWRVLQELNHPNIVQIYNRRAETRNGWTYHVITMEYCERGSLKEVLHDTTILYTMKTVLWWAEQLLSALTYIAEKKIIHRDIKPENILVKENFILKLADFGSIRELNKTSTLTFAGTSRYMSPEASGARGQKLAIFLQSDLYAMGLVLWEIIERRTVYSTYGKSHDFNQFALFLDLSMEKYTLPLADCTHPIKDIIKDCTAFRYEDRPAVDEVYKKIKNWTLEYSLLSFEPIIHPDNKKLIRPIGFDDSCQQVEVREIDEVVSSSADCSFSAKVSSNPIKSSGTPCTVGLGKKPNGTLKTTKCDLMCTGDEQREEPETMGDSKYFFVGAAAALAALVLSQWRR